MTYEQIAEESKIPLSTIKNIFSGKNEPLATNLNRIATALKVTLNDLLADANVVLASSSIIEVQETLEEVKVTLAETEENLAKVEESATIIESERDLIKIENKRLKAENERLKIDNANLDTELKLLKQELQHKDELLPLMGRGFLLHCRVGEYLDIERLHVAVGLALAQSLIDIGGLDAKTADGVVPADALIADASPDGVLRKLVIQKCPQPHAKGTGHLLHGADAGIHFVIF